MSASSSRRAAVEGESRGYSQARLLRGPLKVQLGFTHTFEARAPRFIDTTFLRFVLLPFMQLPRAAV